MSKKFNYVYITTNLINGKQYVGDHSTDFLDDDYLGSGKYLKRAFKKYEKENFNKEILETCESKEEAFNKQEKYINEYDTLVPNGYNISPKGGLGVKKGLSKKTIDKIRNKLLGRKDSKETKKKKSEARKGAKNPNFKGTWYGKNPGIKQKGKTKEEIWGFDKAKEIKLKISKNTAGKNNPMYGKKHSEETKNKLKKPKTEEHKNKLSIAKKNAKKKTCYYCGKTMDPSNYGQYHGDKCKLKNKNYE